MTAKDEHQTTGEEDLFFFWEGGLDLQSMIYVNELLFRFGVISPMYSSLLFCIKLVSLIECTYI